MNKYKYLLTILAFLSILISCNSDDEAELKINSISPLNAKYGQEITITGNNFDFEISENKVYFGNIEATITYADKNTLKVIVPNDLESVSEPIKVIAQLQELVFNENFQLILPELLSKETIIDRNSGEISKIHNFYYEDKRLVQIDRTRVYNNTTTTVFKIEYLNDLPVRIDKYDSNNELSSVITPVYNGNQLIEYNVYRPNSNTTYQVVFTYNGNIISRSDSNYILSIDANFNFRHMEDDPNDDYIHYNYDGKNGKYKNIASKNILNLCGVFREIDGLFYQGTYNNSATYRHEGYTFEVNMVSNYEYSINDFPLTMTLINTQIGTAGHTAKYEY